MNKSVVAVLIACGVFVGTAREASAQSPWTDRGYINIGWGVESGSSTMTDTRTGSIYEEPGTITTSTTFSSGALVPDVDLGIRIWKNLTVGAGFSQDVNTADTSVTGSIPSPVFFNKPRALNDTIKNLERKEQATHVTIGWVIPFSPKMDVMVFGGPTFFRLTQDMVSDVTIGENGGDYTKVVAKPSITNVGKSVTGFNAGVNATYIVWSNDSVRLGAGAFLRFTQASTKLMMLSSEQPTEVGGMQYGIGAHIRF